MTVTEISPLELKERLSGTTLPVLLDVREPWELDIMRLADIINIPMNDIGKRVPELDPAREVVVICRSGARSYSVAQWLAAQGFQRVVNLAGGMLAWRAQVDPSLPTY
ncbi:MAG: rhodanese-like domain-containing protein [Steroidobacteraceae bacterium]